MKGSLDLSYGARCRAEFKELFCNCSSEMGGVVTHFLTCLAHNISRKTQETETPDFTYRDFKSKQRGPKNSISVTVCLPCRSFSSTWAGRQRSPALWCHKLALFPWHFCSRPMWCCWTSPGQQCPWMKPKRITSLYRQCRGTETFQEIKQLIGQFDANMFLIH